MKWFSLMAILLALAAVAGAQSKKGGDSGGGYSIVGDSITGASEIKPLAVKTESKLELDSSDKRLVDTFNWAKSQAMAFTFDGSQDAVGPWYEAAEPGREDFCMRDMSHQAMGAHALGLARQNLNMLRKFAENATESRDWCSLWEIDRFNRPAPVDYKNDAEFWYCLPASFDILDCCFRMYVWTGDQTYVNDPVFLNYYDHTVTDYVERWGLGLDQIMKRPRLLNIRGIPDLTKKFVPNRGLPGYDEQDKNFVLSFDVLSTQYTAYRDYSYIQDIRKNHERAELFQKKAADLRAMVMKTWWNEQGQYFYSKLTTDYKLTGRGGGRRGSGLDWGTVRFNNPDADNDRMLNTRRSRLEYPEVSFSKVGDIVNGTMGINQVFTSMSQSAVAGYWVETQVQTLPGLGTKIAWAEMRNLPIRNNEVTVRHDGTRKTTLTNQHGPALIWLPTFDGAHSALLVNGVSARAKTVKDESGRETSSVRVTVGPAGSVTVEIPK